MADRELTLDTLVTANPGLMVSEVEGELVMMDVEKGSYYGLDPVAARIWQSVQQPTSVGDVCAQMLEHYDVEPETCQTEVLAFVVDLERAGLVALT